MNSLKKYISLLFLFLASCSNVNEDLNEEIDISVLLPYLEQSNVSSQKEMLDKYSYTVKQIGTPDDKPKETYLYIHSKKTHAIYNNLKSWFNSNIHDKKNDSLINHWGTDEKEYILYKQDDSTIFVNIYNKR